MKCQEFEPIIISLARGQLVETAAREAALDHIEQCARCAIVFEEQQSLTVGIRIAAVRVANQGASAQVEDALRLAFREQAGRFISTGGVSLTRKNWSWSWRLAGAAAAIILLALLAGVSWLKSLPANEKREATNFPATPSITDPGQKQGAQARTEGRENQHQKTANHSAGSRRQRRGHRVRHSAAIPMEVATRFYPLVREDEMAPLESGKVVRVEVPASTLISLGLPITAESVNRSVRADLLLGQDGLARAIRFLP
ncbi:MAG TPA: hypothetical protein VJ810_30245 [Blastocatellia bacterium]|nr:hypothetical protein [Blastocatellia bacterium]